ncbi:Deoxyribose-phosphate aldolase [Moorella glycerini]|uniref:Deoxyribose-phosphate aldolase n=1 Tax=Neomoorella stamsii TaxID=1266720 RepID=A0A9X7P747_9FIRM|nr:MULTISPECIES: deoxyribose-phosphate aldolase [Moorella]PRR76109.1 Deoxyribose-phosphate aldolase [Moorella stamsii]CEP68285.1 Deoxyribose-phosphate aldolase [Moorella glycerini]
MTWEEYQILHRQALEILHMEWPQFFNGLQVHKVTETWQDDVTQIPAIIDHTALKPDTTAYIIEQLCREAIKYKFYSVCVAPCWVELAASILRGQKVKVCTVIGFPHGNTLKQVKVYEAAEAATIGADELDMVINIGALKSRKLKLVFEEITAVRETIGSKPILKVILETSTLDNVEKIIGSLIAIRAGANFVKTSTGFTGGGATVSDVRLLRWTVGGKVGVKASGGIRDLETALTMVRAGANRLGTSSGVVIAREFFNKKGASL